jgi:TonB family protein
VVNFVIHIPSQPDAMGVYRRDSLDATHHRQRLTVANYDEIWVSSGTVSWRNHPDVHVRPPFAYVSEYAPPVPPGKPNLKIERVTTPTANVECVQFKEFVDARCYQDGLLIGEESRYTKVAYSQFQKFGGKEVATHYQVDSADGSRVIADVKFETGTDIKPETFDPPASTGLKVIPKCTPVEAPVVKFAPDPHFPDSDGKEGTVILWVVVGKDGKPHDVSVVDPLTPSNDREALRAVSQWTFKPATCGGMPTDVQINIEVNFKKF